MTLRAIDLSLELGQDILVGKSKTPAKITKIEYHEKSGDDNLMCPADKYR